MALMWSSKDAMFFFGSYPRGVAERHLVEELRVFNSSVGRTMTTYCFGAVEAPGNDTGITVWDMPAEWWSVGFGEAFTKFVDPSKTYKLTHNGPPCDATFIIKDGHLIRQAE